MDRSGGIDLRAACSVLGLTLAVSASCARGTDADLVYEPIAHHEDVESWRGWRHDQLARPDGWLSLVGLYWLKEGDNDFGSAADNALVYDRDDVPQQLGTFRVETSRVTFLAAEGIEVTVGNGKARELIAHGGSKDAQAPVIEWGSLRWQVITRNERLAVRLKDSESPVLTNFDAMENFDLSSRWWRAGHFDAYDPPRTIKVPNVLGTLDDEESPGAAVFEVDGETYRLDLWRDSDDPVNFFTAFGDATNVESTYGAGRFLWIDAPDESGQMVVDFNKAYNPPCAFTPFVTCPLPPQQNRLALRIEAGEKTFK